MVLVMLMVIYVPNVHVVAHRASCWMQIKRLRIVIWEPLNMRPGPSKHVLLVLLLRSICIELITLVASTIIFLTLVISFGAWYQLQCYTLGA